MKLHRRFLVLAALVVLSPAAFAKTCAVAIEGNDQMKFNLPTIKLAADCTQVTVTLKHTGKMAANVMGHNWVLSKEADMAGIAADGMAVAPEHVKPDDARIVAHTKMLGGGESASVTFDVAKIKDGGYKFFCSFPGHLALMQGSIQVQ